MTEGAKVAYEDDPKEQGTVVAIMFTRIFVKWDKYGKTTIEPAHKLQLV